MQRRGSVHEGPSAMKCPCLHRIYFLAVVVLCSKLFKVQANGERSFLKCNYQTGKSESVCRSVIDTLDCEKPQFLFNIGEYHIFGVLVERWANVNDMEDLKASSQTRPSKDRFIQALDAPGDRSLQNTGLRLRAYFLAPQTGNYTFYLACDDSCELNLSTDERPENGVSLVTIPSYTSYQGWTSWNRKEVPLKKDRSYFLEALLVQNDGDYHLSVGVKFPDGSYSRPVSKEYLVKYTPGTLPGNANKDAEGCTKGLYGEAPAGDWGEWSRCSTTCGVGTQERHRLCPSPPPVYSRLSSSVNHTEARVCEPARPCSVPASSIRVDNTSPTSLLVTWHSQWQDRWLSDLRGFRIFYNRESGETARNVTVGASETSVELQELAVFSSYCIRVVLLTVAATGMPSPCVMSTTAQDVPCSSPSGLFARSYSGPYKIRARWEALPQSCWQGVPRGYSLRLRVLRSAHDGDGDGDIAWSGEVRVGPLSTSALVEGLRTYTTYSVQVSALTDKGPGPYSDPIFVDTCRCPVRLLANWLQAPPLYFKARATNVTSPIGLLPARLQHVIDHVCGTCHGHKRTEVVYRQQNNSLQALTSSMTAHVQLYLPISMVPRMPFEMPEWAFLPMVEVAGLAVITRKISTEVYSSKLGSSLLERWPVFVVLFVLYVTIGIVVWTLECHGNPTQFDPSFSEGCGNGFWWAFVSMTTVGYGRYYPRSVPGRLIGMASLLVGLVLNALFVGALSSSLTVFVVDQEANPQRNSMIGVVSGSVEHQFAMRKNGSKGVKCMVRSYPAMDDLLSDVRSEKLNGVLTDLLTAEPFLKDLNDPSYEVSKVIPRNFFYGIILTGDARCLLKNLTDFLSRGTLEKPIKPKRTLSRRKSTHRKTEPTESDQGEMINFFDPENALYQKTVKAIGAGLVALLAAGILYHTVGGRQLNKRDQPRTGRLDTNELKAEMRQLLEEFHARIHQRYHTLKHKHKQEVLQLALLRAASPVAVVVEQRG